MSQTCCPSQVISIINGKGPIAASWHVSYDALHGFYRYALSCGQVGGFPSPTVKPKRTQPLVRYIYSEDELRRLLAATLADQKNPGHLEPDMVRTMLLLLYGAGLRPSEALSLKLVDVDLEQSVLTIHDSKFFTSRLAHIGTCLNEKPRQCLVHRR